MVVEAEGRAQVGRALRTRSIIGSYKFRHHPYMGPNVRQLGRYLLR